VPSETSGIHLKSPSFSQKTGVHLILLCARPTWYPGNEETRFQTSLLNKAPKVTEKSGKRCIVKELTTSKSKTDFHTSFFKALNKRVSKTPGSLLLESKSM
jgi:hypothetical protein